VSGARAISNDLVERLNTARLELEELKDLEEAHRETLTIGGEAWKASIARWRALYDVHQALTIIVGETAHGRRIVLGEEAPDGSS
jgi:hypothetical protein